MDRDPRTGRFLPGNKAAQGNRGNTYPKWGNKNAIKHGLYSVRFHPVLSKDKKILHIVISKNKVVSFYPGEWKRDELGNIIIFGEKALFLESIGMELLDCIP